MNCFSTEEMVFDDDGGVDWFVLSFVGFLDLLIVESRQLRLKVVIC